MENKIEMLNRINSNIYMADEFLARFILPEGYAGRYYHNDMFIRLFAIRTSIHGLIKLQDSLFLDNVYTHI